MPDVIVSSDAADREPPRGATDVPRRSRKAHDPPDDYLIASVLSGDEVALRAIIDRYDRVVRYSIFRVSKDRCRTDPFWLDSVASTTWTGFVKAIRSDQDPPRSLPTFLITIARRQAISALRSAVRDAKRDPAQLGDVSVESEDVPPDRLLVQAEDLVALRDHLAELPDDDRACLTQLDAIVRRRWVEAAVQLGVSESTLRSRWKRILEFLRSRMS